MSGMHGVARVMRWTAGGLGFLAVGYATVAGTSWYRYGRVPSASPDERDPLLDQFMPEYEVAERHHVRVAAPAAMTLSARSLLWFFGLAYAVSWALWLPAVLASVSLIGPVSGRRDSSWGPRIIEPASA